MSSILECIYSFNIIFLTAFKILQTKSYKPYILGSFLFNKELTLLYYSLTSTNTYKDNSLLTKLQSLDQYYTC